MSARTRNSHTHIQVSFELATEKDTPQLIEMMRELYQHDAISTFTEEVARTGLQQMLLQPSLGSAYLILADDRLAGYLLLTSCFSLEFHGRFLLLDELYLREGFRRRGLGKAAVVFAETISRKAGIRALRLEVGKSNKEAQSLYDSMGFKREARYLCSKWL